MDLAKAAPWLALARVPGVGPRRFAALVQHFGHPQAVLEARREDLRAVPEVLPGVVQALVEAAYRWRRGFGQDPEVARDLEMAASCGAEIVGFGTDEYPESLARIPDPPPLLYMRGKVRPWAQPAVAIVGSRRATGYGRMVAERLAADLAGRGIVIVSGLARGIDGSAHRGALSVSAPTVAVLGSGVDVIYPPEHRTLFERVLEEGAILSELPPGTQPESRHFPVRNRIISGLSRGVVVVEAADRSGALITVDYALEQGRDVFAVPGNVTSVMSRGPHQLLRQGARLVESAQDVLEELGLADSKAGCSPPTAGPHTTGATPQPKAAPLLTSNQEQNIYDLLGGQPLDVDELAAASGLGAADVQTALLLLELRDLAATLPGPRYIRKV